MILCRSRQQPSAALRGGALRAAASRPCLSTFRASEEFITTVIRGRRTGCLIPLTPAAFGCAPLGRTSCGGQSALPQHFVLRSFVIFRSRKQPAAALRGGGPGRPEARSGLVGDHHIGRCGPLFIILVEQLCSALRASRCSLSPNNPPDEFLLGTKCRGKRDCASHEVRPSGAQPQAA